MSVLNGTILSGNTPVAKVRDGVVTVTNEQLAPLYFRRSKDAEAWLSGRAIDSHRANGSRKTYLTTSHCGEIPMGSASVRRARRS